jgi:hypothetical protein
MQRLIERKTEKQVSQEIPSPCIIEVNPRSACYYNGRCHEKTWLNYKHRRQIYTETAQAG